MTLTEALILGIITLIAVSDVWLVWEKHPTYSQTMKRLGARVSFLPYAWGVVGGHFFGPSSHPVVHAWWAVLLWLVGIGLALTLAHLMVLAFRLGWGFWLSLTIYLPIGLVAGALIWAQ